MKSFTKTVLIMILAFTPSGYASTTMEEERPKHRHTVPDSLKGVRVIKSWYKDGDTMHAAATLHTAKDSKDGTKLKKATPDQLSTFTTLDLSHLSSDFVTKHIDDLVAIFSQISYVQFTSPFSLNVPKNISDLVFGLSITGDQDLLLAANTPQKIAQRLKVLHKVSANYTPKQCTQFGNLLQKKFDINDALARAKTAMHDLAKLGVIPSIGHPLNPQYSNEQVWLWLEKASELFYQVDESSGLSKRKGSRISRGSFLKRKTKTSSNETEAKELDDNEERLLILSAALRIDENKIHLVVEAFNATQGNSLRFMPRVGWINHLRGLDLDDLKKIVGSKEDVKKMFEGRNSIETRIERINEFLSNSPRTMQTNLQKRLTTGGGNKSSWRKSWEKKQKEKDTIVRRNSTGSTSEHDVLPTRPRHNSMSDSGSEQLPGVGMISPINLSSLIAAEKRK